MQLKILLNENRATIVNQWYDRVVHSYKADVAKFLKSQKDQFANPVGSTVVRSLEPLFAALINAESTSQMASILDPILRIRAVQGFTPSQSIAFVFDLKKIVRKQLNKELASADLTLQMQRFEEAVDAMAMVAFDVYMQCREKIFELKANELGHRTIRVLRRAKLIDPED